MAGMCEINNNKGMYLCHCYSKGAKKAGMQVCESYGMEVGWARTLLHVEWQ